MAKPKEETAPLEDGETMEITEADVSRDNVPSTPEAQQIMDKIAAEILAAETVEDILEGGQTTPVEGILDQPVIIHSFAVRKGDLGPFAVIDCVDDDTGEILTVSCGGQLVLAALASFERLDSFPVRVRFAQAGRAFRLLKPLGDRSFEVSAS
jgi:hypothetical protein